MAESPVGIAAERGRADVEVFLTAVDPDWGFRSGLEQQSRMYPEMAERRIGEGGLWIPFTSPAGIADVDDFHIRVHEGANSVEEDDALGILSFVYIEPWDYWVDLGDFDAAPEYADGLERLEDQAAGGGAYTEAQVQMARGTFVGGHRDSDSGFLHRIENRPWIPGSGWSTATGS